MQRPTDFMATWRNLRSQRDCADHIRQRHVRRLMQSLLEQYGSELRQEELSECVADLEPGAPPTSATDHHRSESPIRS